MTVTRRGKSWQFVFDAGRDAEGHRRQVRRGGFRTKKDAEIGEAAERLNYIDLAPVSGDKLPLAVYMDRWLAGKSLKASTAQRYEELNRLHVRPEIGTLTLRKLRPLDVQSCYTSIRAKGRSERTVLHVHRMLKQALEQAVKWQLIGRNPAAAVQPPSPSKPSTYTPTLEEAVRLMDLAADSPYAPVFRLALLTGLREGELLALRWTDVGPATLSVSRNARRLKGQGVVMLEAKTRASSRTVALGDLAIAVLQAHRRAQAEEKMRERLDYVDLGLVFAGPLGQPIDGSYVGRAWKKIAATAGLPSVRVHDLRHAHASLLLQAGVNLKVVSERLGHSSIAITGDIYSHVAPNMQAEAAALLDAMLNNRRDQVVTN